MRKQNVGFSLLLLGLIFAVTVESYIGVVLGLVGVGIVMANSKEER